MKTLNRYLLKKLLVNWVLILLGIIILVVLGDMVSHIKHLGTLHTNAGNNTVFFKELIHYYLFDQLPIWLPIFLPIAALAATTLLVIQLKRHHEWVAMSSGNLSIARRVVMPLTLLALLTSALQWWDQEKWLPQLRHVSLKDRPLKENDDYSQLKGINEEDQGRLQCTWYKKNTDRVHDVILIVPKKFIIKAKTGTWTNEGWMLEEVSKHDFMLGLANPLHTTQHKKWLWKSKLSLKKLDELNRPHEYLSRHQLKKIAARYPKDRSLQMDTLSRLTHYFMVWVLLFVGFPLVMAGQGGVQCVLRATVSFLIVYFLYLFCYKIGVGGLPILLSCALAPGLSVAIGFHFWKKMPS